MIFQDTGSGDRRLESLEGPRFLAARGAQGDIVEDEARLLGWVQAAYIVFQLLIAGGADDMVDTSTPALAIVP